MPLVHLDEINKFFGDLKETPMPQELRSLMLRKNVFMSGKLETADIGYKTLVEHSSPEIAKKIQRFNLRDSLPVVLNSETLEYFVYSPQTGKYVADFKSNQILMPFNFS